MITMTSLKQKNMQTVLGNGKVSNIGLYKTGGNTVTEDWDENYVPEEWEEREEWEGCEMECSDDDETVVEVQDNAHFQESRQILLQDIAAQAVRQVQAQQKQDILDCVEIKKVLGRVAEKKVMKVVALNTREYPAMNAAPMVKKQQSSPGCKTVRTAAVWTEVKSKKGSLTFQLGAGSMIADRKNEKRQRFAKTNDIRDKAYDLLGDKEELAKSLRKTTMCRSVGKLNANGTPTKCSYGDRCQFAHSAGELQVRVCKFEDRCRFIYTTPNGQIRNRRDCRTCTAKHPSETDDAHLARIGICKIAKPRVVSPKPVVLPKFSKAGLAKEKVRVITENKEKMTSDKKASGGTGWSHMMKRSAVQPTPISRSPSPAAKVNDGTNQDRFAVDGWKEQGGWQVPVMSATGIVSTEMTKTQKKNLHRKRQRAEASGTTVTSSSPPTVPSTPISRSPSPTAKKHKITDVKVTPISRSPSPATETTVMKVPAEFMGQAIEMAMKLGKTNIKFECA